MVLVKSSRGGDVQIEIKGVAEVLAYIRRKGKDVNQGADLGTFQAANFVQSEVQESIIGNRAEKKSVDTGRLGNSIEVDKIDEAIYKIFPRKTNYPGTKTTTQDVASILEYGTSRLTPRKHFGNTQARTKNKVKIIVQNKIKQSIRRKI